MSLSMQSTLLVLTTRNEEIKHYVHPKHKQETEENSLIKITIYTLIWYDFYDHQPGKRAGPIHTRPEPGWQKRLSKVQLVRLLLSHTMQQSVITWCRQVAQKSKPLLAISRKIYRWASRCAHLLWHKKDHKCCSRSFWKNRNAEYLKNNLHQWSLLSINRKPDSTVADGPWRLSRPFILCICRCQHICHIQVSNFEANRKINTKVSQCSTY